MLNIPSHNQSKRSTKSICRSVKRSSSLPLLASCKVGSSRAFQETLSTVFQQQVLNRIEKRTKEALDAQIKEAFNSLR
ncbi:hypothetical protein KFK09_012291 [Dendrobium nobile]|uniref:Uncharacterized protein n=1 Tax=Dendrobium nobile TaxID=94219 RepID=A0A8T3BIH2_DENNO|nr:hypothetical protein KFK09_012291 [Dendrobium nobile]